MPAVRVLTRHQRLLVCLSPLICRSLSLPSHRADYERGSTTATTVTALLSRLFKSSCLPVFHLFGVVWLLCSLCRVEQFLPGTVPYFRRPRKFRRLTMKVFYKRTLMRRIAIGTLISVLLILFLLYVVIPIIFKYSPGLQKGLLYLSSVNLPVDFKNPKKYVNGSRNFYITSNLTTEENIRLGTWHILPKSLVSNTISTTKPPSNEQFDRWLSNGEPVFIYMHGNSGNRGTGHRIDLYKMLQNSNYHVIAFDYRSYGDSGQGVLSEDGTVRDATAVYRWTKQHVKGNAKIFFWGHSLGTGISSHVLAELEKHNESSVAGLVLEAPFNNLSEEIKSYPLAQIWSFLPWFDYFFTSPMTENGLKYESDKNLLNVTAPILILHAEDDMVIPIALSKRLYERITSARDSSSIEFKTYPSNLHYGHKFIVKDKTLPETISAFVNKSINFLRRS